MKIYADLGNLQKKVGDLVFVYKADNIWKVTEDSNKTSGLVKNIKNNVAFIELVQTSLGVDSGTALGVELPLDIKVSGELIVTIEED